MYQACRQWPISWESSRWHGRTRIQMTGLMVIYANATFTPHVHTQTHKQIRTYIIVHIFFVVSWLLPDIPLRDQGVGGSNLVLFR